MVVNPLLRGGCLQISVRTCHDGRSRFGKITRKKVGPKTLGGVITQFVSSRGPSCGSFAFVLVHGTGGFLREMPVDLDTIHGSYGN